MKKTKYITPKITVVYMDIENTFMDFTPSIPIYGEGGNKNENGTSTPPQTGGGNQTVGESKGISFDDWGEPNWD